MHSDTPGVATPFRYWAFISYSQRDADWAKRLHAFLESYRIPSALVGRRGDGRLIPKRLHPVFRDRDELPGSPDLGALLREALASANSLIVICSPHAAASTWVNEEIRTFKASGRSNRCFPLIVAAPPVEAGQSDRIAEIFPNALRFEVTPDGAVSDRPVEPLAADARTDKDGWHDACLKLVAGVLGVGFDDLRRRDEARRRRQRVWRGVAAAAVIAAAACGYLGLADADVSVPGGDTIRRELDHYGVTLFRPVLDDGAMARLAIAIRAAQRKRLLADVATRKIEQDKPISAWTVGEVVGSGFRDRDAKPDELRQILYLMRLLFPSSHPGKPDGYMLTDTPDDVGNPGRAEPILWSIIALSTILSRTDVIGADERKAFEDYLAIAQRIAEAFHPDPGGGWNTATRQVDPRRHFNYTTGLALHALLEVRAAKVGWLGSHEELDRMIAGTAAWLQGAFVQDSTRSGWRRSLDDDRPPDAGITLLVHGAIGRACADAGVPVSEPVRAAAVALLTDLRHRRYESSDPDIRFDIRTVDAGGERRTQVSVTRMIWFPWAVEGLVGWRRCAQRLDLPPEIKRSLDRSLGHLLKDVAPEMLRDVMRPERLLWINAETYYGLGSAP